MHRDNHQKEMAESKSGGLAATLQNITSQHSKHLLPENSCTWVRTTVLNHCTEAICEGSLDVLMQRDKHQKKMAESNIGGFGTLQKSPGSTANTFRQTTAILG